MKNNKNHIFRFLLSNLSNLEKDAFCIEEEFYSYSFLKNRIGGIQEKLKLLPSQSKIGIYTSNNIDTYASILATWLSGNIFIPLSENQPKERLQQIINEANLDLIICYSQDDISDLEIHSPIVETRKVVNNSTLFNYEYQAEDILYILFTSGSTGTPKGVKIHFENLNSFIFDFKDLGFPINKDDKVLQLYDLGFDASIHCYLLALVSGACTYTVSGKKIKFLEAYKIMNEHNISFAKMPPTTLQYLSPFFQKMNLPKLKYLLLGGEALKVGLLSSAISCFPNACIWNVYGPTEVTINCTAYAINTKTILSKNNVVSIGSTFGSSEYQISNEGELLISGKQVSPGYLKDKKEAFSIINQTRYYHTGDLVEETENGNLLYLGRMDEQVQIDGYRVELGEIEAKCKAIISENLYVLYLEEENKLVLCIETIQEDYPVKSLKIQLEEKLPTYMTPKMIILKKHFPTFTSGKLDKKTLKKQLANS